MQPDVPTAEPIRSSRRRPSKRYEPGRPCEWPGCITRLNSYHRGPYCYAHEGRRVRDDAPFTAAARRLAEGT